MNIRLIFSLLLALLLGACGGPKHQPLPAGATALVLGDSVSHGTGAGEGQDYPTLLATLTGWHIVNASVPGDTSADGLSRLPDLLDRNKPKLVLVELGGNDFLRQTSRAQTVANLKAILLECRTRGIPAVLIAVPRPSLAGAVIGHLSDDPIYRELANNTETPLIEDILADVLSSNDLKSDHIHPNAAGYRKIAQGLQAELRELGFLRNE